MTALSPEAKELLYLECYQIILHGQVESFIKLGLPTELEVIPIRMSSQYSKL
jgi:hypothetical protein